jgi:hypothetical protein
MATKTPKLELVELQIADLPAADKFNETIYKLDTVVQLGVISRVATAPTSDVQGSAFIVPDVGLTGVFVGQARKVAYRSPTGWLFRPPRVGWLAYVANEDKYYRFNSAGEWVDSLIATPATVVFDEDSDGLVPAPGTTTGKFLRDDATWRTITIPDELTDLSDIDFSGLADKDAIEYDLASGKWKNIVAKTVFQKGAQWVDVSGAEVTVPTNDVIAILPRAGTLKKAILSGLGGTLEDCAVGISSVVGGDYPPDIVADDITGGTPIAIVTGTQVIDTTFAGWTKTVFAQGDVIRFNLVSSSGFTLVEIILEFA